MASPPPKRKMVSAKRQRQETERTDRKRGNLQQFVNNKEATNRPDVKPLQEARQLAKLSGYLSNGTDAKVKTQVVTLVKRNVPVIVHDTGISTVEHVLLDSHDCALSLITDSGHPTRRGDVKHKDTTPDLRVVRFVKDATWENTWEDLGRDHCILKATLMAGPGKSKAKKWMIMKWNEFQKLLDECTTEKRAIKTIPKEADVAAADSRLLHLWETKARMQERLRSRRGSLGPRQRIAQTNREIESHADRITRQQWQHMCDGFDGELNVPKTWNILRHLLDLEGSKTVQRNKMCEIICWHEGAEDDFVKDIRKRYIGDNLPRQPTEYNGAENDALNAGITEVEVFESLRGLKTKSAPGSDGVTNQMLRHLSDEAIAGITKYRNACWSRGSIPRQWKTAKVVMISKQEKTPQLVPLRPISLTSCVGKLMKHVILSRMNGYMDDNELFPHTMVGCPPKTSRNFDNIRHDAVLENLERLGVGRRTYNYVHDFLSDRTAQISFGGVTSEEIKLGGRGTPQGWAFSPYFFNVIMIGLPARLSKIEALHHRMYSDDITLWYTLQEAILVGEEYITPRGLACSPQKSKLLLLKPAWSRQLPSDIELHLHGLRIPTVKSIRVLRLRVQADGHNSEMIASLKASTYQISRLIARISGRKFGMKEKNLVCLVRAFVVTWGREKDKLDCLVRKGFKRALGVPDSASNEKLATLGLHNAI
ncbi:hypothetical protein HPB47_009191 [Ixodes persulcatus]|uniref:Uncharacterized protein n=1 Tax=Ixodes persulcatus TaxID=34615 RepID=A0AC60P2R9_IXOPE|nr:hypothetical protein HPB47_009191 [Ixodes persulcatus]